MGKTWDTEKIEKFIESFAGAYDRYTDDLHSLEDGMSKYYFNDTYRGQAAEASKNFIGEGQNKLHMKQINIQRRLVLKYYEMLDAFKDKVDPSPTARIDTDQLMDIKKRFLVCDNVIDVEGYNIECKTKYIADKFGHINGNLIPSSYRMVGEMYEDFCGSGGLFDYCVKKVEEFDAEMCSDVNNSGIEYDVDTLQDKVVATASALDSIQVKVENMSKFSLGLVSLNAKGLTEEEKKELRKKAKEIYISKLFGKIDGTGYHGTFEDSFIVKNSNRTRIGAVNDSFITVTDVPGKNGKLTTTYGGAQEWFKDAPNFDEKYRKKLSDFGCGAIASVNQYLYLTGQTTISYDDYKQLIYDFVDAKDKPSGQALEAFNRKTALYTINGYTPKQMTGYVTRMCDSKGVNISTKWDCAQDYEKDYQSMKEQLNKGVPVIWSVNDFENCGKDNNDVTKTGVKFYTYDESSGEYKAIKNPVTSHYVTATAIYEDADENGKKRRMVEISSWGNKYYVDYDQYIDIVHSTTNNEPFSSITHTTVK